MRSEFVNVAGWTRNSFVDFPGTIATVLFFSGCNLRCPYCHNPHIVCEKPASFIHSDAIWSFLDKRQDQIEGVVLSGGEPTLTPHLDGLIPQIKELGYKVKLDTNGLLPDIVRLCPVDYCALDIKSTPENYPTLLKAHLSVDEVAMRLKASIGIVRDMAENAEVRITIAPDIITKEIIASLAKMLHGVKKIFLQPMGQKVPLLDPDYTIKPVLAMSGIKEYREILRGTGAACEIRSDW